MQGNYDIEVVSKILDCLIESKVLASCISHRLLSYIGESNESDAGFILHCLPGGGKTAFLKLIEFIFPYPMCGYYNNRMPPSRFSNLLCNCKIVLIDNIDNIDDLSLILNAIDNSTTCFVATSSSELDRRLTQRYRLGLAIELPRLSIDRQREIFDVCDLDNHLANEFAVQYRHCNVGELVKVCRDICLSNGNLNYSFATIDENQAGQPTSNKNVNEMPNLMCFQSIQCKLIKSLYSTIDNGLQPLHRLPTGYVFYGSSGNGKTSLVNWLAAVSRKDFKLVNIPCSDMVHKVVGDTEKYISKVFDYARKNGPCYILLDNLDSIMHVRGQEGRQRTTMKTIDRLLSSLLVEIDGLAQNSREHTTQKFQSSSVVVIATVNKLESLDRSLIRPGRLEEHINMKNPSKKQRHCVFSHLLCEIDPVLVEKLGFKYHNASFAELIEVIHNAELSYLKAIMNQSLSCSKNVYLNKYFQEII